MSEELKLFHKKNIYLNYLKNEKINNSALKFDLVIFQGVCALQIIWYTIKHLLL